MLARMFAFLLLVLCVSVLAQHPGVGARLNGKMWSDREIRPEPPPANPQAVRLQATATRRNSLNLVPLCKRSSISCKKEGCTKTWPRT
jgi:hypothetical protein